MKKGMTRRNFLKTATAAAAAAGTSQIFAPAFLKAQQTPIKIGHLVPLTGFLSPMGDYASKAGKLAIEEINAAGGVLGPATGDHRRRRDEPGRGRAEGHQDDPAGQGGLPPRHREQRRGVGDHGRGRAVPEDLLQYRVELGRDPRGQVQLLHLLHRGLQHPVREGHRPLPGQEQELQDLLHPHLGLRLRPRSDPRHPAPPERAGRQGDRSRPGAHRNGRLQLLSPQDPERQAGGHLRATSPGPTRPRSSSSTPSSA